MDIYRVMSALTHRSINFGYPQTRRPRINTIDVEYENWKLSVLNDHMLIEQRSKDIIKTSRCFRRESVKVWDEVKTLRKTWKEFEDELGTACKLLGERIEIDELAQEMKKNGNCCNPILRRNLKRAVKRASIIAMIWNSHKFK